MSNKRKSNKYQEITSDEDHSDSEEIDDDDEDDSSDNNNTDDDNELIKYRFYKKNKIMRVEDDGDSDDDFDQDNSKIGSITFINDLFNKMENEILVISNLKCLKVVHKNINDFPFAKQLCIDYPILKFKEDIEILSALLIKNSKIKELDLRFSLIKNIDKANWSNFMKLFRKIPHIEYINISEVMFGSSEELATEFFKGLTYLSNIKILKLNSIFLNEKENLYVGNKKIEKFMQFLSNFLKDNKTLKKLKITAIPNHNQNNVFMAIGSILSSNKTIDTISLSFSNKEINVSELNFNLFLKNLETNQSITNLKIHNMAINNEKLLVNFGESLQRNQSIQKLKLASVFTKVVNPIKSFQKAIQVTNSIKFLSFEDSIFFQDYNNTILLANALKENNSIVKLNLFNNNLTKKSLLCLLQSLKINNGLEELDLSENKFNQLELIQSLKDLIIENKTINTLILRRCLLQVNEISLESTELFSHNILMILGSAFQKNTILKFLDLSSNDLGNYFLNPIQDLGLVNNKSIKTLDLSFNNLGKFSDIALDLAFFIEQNTTLINLNLNSNELGLLPEDSEQSNINALFISLKFNSTLLSLSLESNCIGDVKSSMKELSYFLQENNTIQSLNLSNNNMVYSEYGISIAHLSIGLIQNKTIRKLKIYNNFSWDNFSGDVTGTNSSFKDYSEIIENIFDSNKTIVSLDLLKKYKYSDKIERSINRNKEKYYKKRSNIVNLFGILSKI
jgi:hypothetical protein